MFRFYNFSKNRKMLLFVFISCKSSQKTPRRNPKKKKFEHCFYFLVCLKQSESCNLQKTAAFLANHNQQYCDFWKCGMCYHCFDILYLGSEVFYTPCSKLNIHSRARISNAVLLNVFTTYYQIRGFYKSLKFSLWKINSTFNFCHSQTV